MPTRKRPKNYPERMKWVKWFLEHPEGLPGSAPIKGVGYHLRGRRLYTIPPEKADIPANALIGEWKVDGTLVLHNTGSPLGEDTLAEAARLGKEYTIDEN